MNRNLMCLSHEELDDAAVAALRKLFLFKYLTGSVDYLQILRLLFNLLGCRPIFNYIGGVNASLRCA